MQLANKQSENPMAQTADSQPPQTLRVELEQTTSAQLRKLPTQLNTPSRFVPHLVRVSQSASGVQRLGRSVPAFKVTNWWPDILLQYFLVESRIHGLFINYGKSSRSWSSKAALDHHTTITMFNWWYDVLFLNCCVSFTPDVTSQTSTKKFHSRLVHPQQRCSQIFFCKSKSSLKSLVTSPSLLKNKSLMSLLVIMSPLSPAATRYTKDTAQLYLYFLDI